MLKKFILIIFMLLFLSACTDTIGGGVINNKSRSKDGKELFVTVFDDNDNTNQTYKIDSYGNWNKFKHNDRVLILSDSVWGVSMRTVK